MSFPKKLPLLILLSLCGLLLSGCVYLRLLQVKKQIGAFERNFFVHTDDGVRIECRKPVLKTDDVRWIGLEPEQTEKRDEVEAWQVRWVKQLPPEVNESGTYDIVLQLEFAADKLRQVTIPERYFEVMPKHLLIDLLRSLGGARIDQDARALEAQLAGAAPDLPGVQRLLGRPSREVVTKKETIYGYRYVPSTGRGLARSAVFDIAVHFENGTDRLLRWEGTTPVGKVGFTFEGKPTGNKSS